MFFKQSFFYCCVVLLNIRILLHAENKPKFTEDSPDNNNKLKTKPKTQKHMLENILMSWFNDRRAKPNKKRNHVNLYLSHVINGKEKVLHKMLTTFIYFLTS